MHTIVSEYYSGTKRITLDVFAPKTNGNHFGYSFAYLITQDMIDDFYKTLRSLEDEWKVEPFGPHL